MKIQIGNTTVQTVRGDITLLSVDAIVNPANSALALGGGVAGAIAKRGGPIIQRECNRIGGARVGTAVITTAGDLPARHVIHAVGPAWGEGDEEPKLRSATRASLELADRIGLTSVAMPAISTGIFGYPLREAARVIVAASREYLGSRPSQLELVVLCLFDENALGAFDAELRRASGTDPPPSAADLVEDALQKAMVASDVEALDRLIDERLLFVAPDGSIYRKSDDLEAHRSGALHFTRIELRDRVVEEYDDLIVVTVLADLDGTLAGAPFSGTYRYIRTWKRTNDGFRVVAGSATAVQKPGN